MSSGIVISASTPTPDPPKPPLMARKSMLGIRVVRGFNFQIRMGFFIILRNRTFSKAQVWCSFYVCVMLAEGTGNLRNGFSPFTSLRIHSWLCSVYSRQGWPQASRRICCRSSGISGACHHIQLLLTWVPGIKLRLSGLHSQCLYLLSIR